MNYVFIAIVAIGMMVWYIRPLYNFFAKRKYALLNDSKLSVSKRIQSGLPAVVFYTLILGAMLYPASTSKIINNFESGTLIVAELILIFFVTRVDKRQTKYSVNNEELKYRGKTISWTENIRITYKKSFLFVLHKPRFIVRTTSTKIIVPVLSKQIGDFIKAIKFNNVDGGNSIQEIYKNIKNYYVSNPKIAKKLNV